MFIDFLHAKIYNFCASISKGVLYKRVKPAPTEKKSNPEIKQ